MGKSLVTTVSPEAVALENILCVMSDMTFGQRVAAKIVGGEKKLMDLIAAGEIAADKPTARQNGKWFCNAADVLRHVRNTRKRH